MPASEKQPGTDRVGPVTDAAYGRNDPAKESGMGRLDNNKFIPEKRPDRPVDAVDNRTAPDRQINGHDALERRDGTVQAGEVLEQAPEQPDHSLLDEEPRGEDLMPLDIKDPEFKRHPKTGGLGGTP